MPDPLGNFSYVWPFYAAVLIGYLAGSIPFALIIGYRAGIGDLRKRGSGNIGATNMLREGGRVLALLTLILDAAKGALPALVAGTYLTQDFAVLAGAGAFLGHLFPVWLKRRSVTELAFAVAVVLALVFAYTLLAGTTNLYLKALGLPLAIGCAFLAWGGKGVATGLGVLLAISWPVGVLALATWLVVALLFRFASVAGIAAFVAAVAYAWWLSDLQRTELAGFLAVFVLVRHFSNVRDLIRGREARISVGGGASKPGP